MQAESVQERVVLPRLPPLRPRPPPTLPTPLPRLLPRGCSSRPVPGRSRILGLSLTALVEGCQTRRPLRVGMG